MKKGKGKGKEAAAARSPLGRASVSAETERGGRRGGPGASARPLTCAARVDVSAVYSA